MDIFNAPRHTAPPAVSGDISHVDLRFAGHVVKRGRMPFMPRMTGARLFAEMMQGYGVSHIFFVPAFMGLAGCVNLFGSGSPSLHAEDALARFWPCA